MNQTHLEQRRQVSQEDFMGRRAPASAIAQRRRRQWTWRASAAAILVAASATSALAQYNSGSSGVHGAFPPAPVPSTARYVLWNLRTGLLRYCATYDVTTRPDICTTEISTAQIPGIPPGGLATGIYEFTNFDFVNPGTTFSVVDLYPVGYDGPVPLRILSQGSFRISRVSIHLEGHDGIGTQTGLPPTGFGAAGGRPGPGGFAGGNGGKQGSPSTGGNAGFGPTGGAGGPANNSPGGAAAAPTPVSTSLNPLIGGSGGGGAGAWDTACGFRGAGGSGAGGGGAVLIAANVQITLDFVSPAIDARGGTGGFGCNGQRGGAGSGGSIRLAAPTIAGNASITVGNGIVRVEGNAPTYSGSIDTVRGTVLSTPQPAIPAEVPTLRITSVGGIAVGPNPTGSIAAPDVTFQTAPSGPVTVDLAASNIPSGTVVLVRANPLIGAPTTANSTALTGSLAISTATASLTIPAGAGVITAISSFPVTTAMLDMLPAIPGMRPALIEVTAEASGASRMFVIGEDSRKVELTMAANGRFAVVP